MVKNDSLVSGEPHIDKLKFPTKEEDSRLTRLTSAQRQRKELEIKHCGYKVAYESETISKLKENTAPKAERYCTKSKPDVIWGPRVQSSSSLRRSA